MKKVAYLFLAVGAALLLGACSSRAETIEITDSPRRMFVGEQAQLAVSVTPQTSRERITFSSSDDSIASIDANGVITAREGGTVQILAIASEVRTAVTLDVVQPAQGIETEDITLVIGQTASLPYSIVPNGGYYEKLDISTSGTCITLEGSTVTAVKPGQAQVTVTADNLHATVTVTVLQYAFQTQEMEQPLELERGNSFTVEYSILDLETGYTVEDDKLIRWSSSNERVATVAAGEITALQAGTCTITARYGDATLTIEVKVTASRTSSSGNPGTSSSYSYTLPESSSYYSSANETPYYSGHRTETNNSTASQNDPPTENAGDAPAQEQAPSEDTERRSTEEDDLSPSTPIPTEPSPPEEISEEEEAIPDVPSLDIEEPATPEPEAAEPVPEE